MRLHADWHTQHSICAEGCEPGAPSLRRHACPLRHCESSYAMRQLHGKVRLSASPFILQRTAGIEPGGQEGRPALLWAHCTCSLAMALHHATVLKARAASGSSAIAMPGCLYAVCRQAMGLPILQTNNPVRALHTTRRTCSCHCRQMCCMLVDSAQPFDDMNVDDTSCKSAYMLRSHSAAAAREGPQRESVQELMPVTCL